MFFEGLFAQTTPQTLCTDRVLACVDGKNIAPTAATKPSQATSTIMHTRIFSLRSTSLGSLRSSPKASTMLIGYYRSEALLGCAQAERTANLIVGKHASLVMTAQATPQESTVGMHNRFCPS